LGDNTGTLQTQYTYEPFGVTTQTGATNTNSYKYTGREDDGTGLYYYRARYYQPRLQRFIAEDPIEFLGGDVNLYAYVESNPVNLNDSLGLDGMGDFVANLPTPPSQLTDFLTGVGDAFLIPILIRDLMDVRGGVNQCSTAYSIGKLVGFIDGLGPFALRGVAALGGTRIGHILNHNRYFRIGPGRIGRNMEPRISSPHLPGDGHYPLTTRIPFIPPLGGPGCSCQ
jgi:RHS repeat-associated protein